MKIVDYEPRFQNAFKRLNVEWIETHWQLEEADHRILDDPQTHIIEPGGHIFIALEGEQTVGTCALIRMTDASFELAKMAVNPASQGLGIGAALGNAVIDRARALGAGRIFLDTNTILEPAIRLYHKLGFNEFVGEPSPYARCDIQMVLDLHA